MSSELKQAEAIVDLLQPEEKEQLKRYIDLSSNREGESDIRPSRKPKLNHEQTMAAWERIKQIGAEMDAQVSGGPSLMEILTEMRSS
jgi:hypothetical protein